MGRVVIPGFRKIETSGGGEGGTTNYNDLTNKPSINNVPLVGNLNTVDLKLTDATLTEEGVPAEAKTVGAKLAEHSTSLTALSNQLGNHTVKSDVPENAVFTDTVYDDTEVKESIDELNSNLDALEFGKISGGKNLFNKETAYIGKVILFSSGEMIINPDYFCTDYIPVIPNTTYVKSAFTRSGENWYYDIDKNPLKPIQENTFTTPENAYYVRLSGYVINVDIAQLEKGSIYTDYEPYIPSVKMLAEDVDSIKNDLIVLEVTSTIDMTASRELDYTTSSTLTIPSDYKPIAMYGYNSDNNDNISAIPLLVRSDGKVLFHAKNHSTSDQGIIHFAIRVTFKKMS